MLLKKKDSIFNTVKFRVTAQFMVLFTLLLTAIFIFSYVLLIYKAEHFFIEDLSFGADRFIMLYQEKGIEAVKEEFSWVAKKEKDEVLFLLLSPQLDILAVSDLSLCEKINIKTDNFLDGYKKEKVLKKMVINGQKMFVLFQKIPDGKIFVIAASFRDVKTLLLDYFKIYGGAIAIILICGGLLGWRITKKMMDGVERVTETAMNIDKGDLNGRVPVKNEGEEMDNLAVAFNEMLERIQILVSELREMINNVAHDLRSPITRIRGMAETTLTGSQFLPEYEKMTGNIIEESDNLIEMINTTLEIAEIESGGSVKNSNSNVDINKVVMDAHDLFLPVAENKQIEFEINAAKESFLTQGNVSKLQRAIANLIDNAIKFTSAGGKVQLVTGADEKFVTVSVVDTGIGISENDLPHIFERFYRAEKSRSTPGNGLGLSLAQAIVTAHGGEITVRSSVGKGTSFKIILPRFLNG